ncbi:MAG: hypothetical protein GW886_01560 [Rhodobacterales bacterium]|nr:hypothetical protein [Rhodobacterales bacterium]
MISMKRLATSSALVLAFAVPAKAQDMDYELINNSGATLMEFYSSPADVGVWEDDILGADVLPDGSRASVTIADGRAQCDYDLRLVFDDGEVLEDTVNICELGSYTIN